MKNAEREEMYKNLIELLRTKGPLSARDLATIQGIKLSAAYQRIRALERDGVTLVQTSVRNGARGPHKTLFGLAPSVQGQLIEGGQE